MSANSPYLIQYTMLYDDNKSTVIFLYINAWREIMGGARHTFAFIAVTEKSFAIYCI